MKNKSIGIMTEALKKSLKEADARIAKAIGKDLIVEVTLIQAFCSNAKVSYKDKIYMINNRFIFAVPLQLKVGDKFNVRHRFLQIIK